MEVGSPTSGGASDVDVFGSDADPRGGSAGRGCAGSARGDAGGQGGGRGCGGGGGGGGAVALELVSIGDGASRGGARAKVAARGGPAGGAASQGDGATLILRLYASRVRVVFAVRHPGSVAMDDGESPSEKIVARARLPRAMPGTSIGTRTSSLSRVARTTARFLSRSCSCTGEKFSRCRGTAPVRGGPRRRAARAPHRRRSSRPARTRAQRAVHPAHELLLAEKRQLPGLHRRHHAVTRQPSPRPRRATVARSGTHATSSDRRLLRRYSVPRVRHCRCFCAFEQFFPGAARHSPRFSSSRAAKKSRRQCWAPRVS